MKIAWFDCFSGISGDMCLGALVDAGVPLGALAKELKKIPVQGYTLKSDKVKRCGISATKVDVVIDKKHSGERRWNHIQQIVKESTLSPSIKKKGLSVFRSLFEAEAKVHGEPTGKIHLHELGAVDCIIDIFGTLIGLEILGIKEVYASPINLGSGTVRTSHGILPVPAPATAELLKGIPVYSSGDPFEKTTPTGAGLIRTLAHGFGSIPAFAPDTTGIGAGGKDPASMPNVLRIIIGDSCHAPEQDTHDITQDTVLVVETNIDDMNPQIYEYASERLFDAGALDVWLTQIMMKKMRPAAKLSVICRRNELPIMTEIIFRETTSIGIRWYETARTIMEREIRNVETGCGTVGIKIARSGTITKATPEYEDCRRLAKKNSVPLAQVMEEARKNATLKKTRSR
jgi:hypothetical protein